MSKFIFLLFIAIIISNISAHSFNDLSKHYFYRKEFITVVNDKSGYTSKIEYKGKFLKSDEKKEYIVYSELETISNIKALYLNNKNKIKNLPENFLSQTAIIDETVFYSGLNAYTIDFSPANSYFEYSYEVKSTELMTLPYLLLNPETKTDTLFYQIEIPISYKIIFEKKDFFIQIDSLLTGKSKVYSILITPDKENKKNITFDKNELYDYSKKSLRFLIYDSSYTPWDYFHKWYYEILKTQNKLNNDTYFNLKDEILSKNISSDSLPYKIFDYVKNKISYISYENGISAFRPRDPNFILNTLKGDCKDIANLLVDILRKSGYEAYIALCSSFDYNFDSSFPSASSFNHAICALRWENKWIFFDATEKESKYGFPSIFTQGQLALIISDSAALFEKIPLIASDINKNEFHIKSQINNNNIESNLNYILSGLNIIEYNTAHSSMTKDDFNMFLKNKLEYLLKNNRIGKTINYERNNNNSIIKTDFSNNNFITKYNSKNYLSINWLPFPHSYRTKPIESDKYIIEKTCSNYFECTIEIGKKINLQEFESVYYSDSTFSYKLEVKNDSDTMKINYFFECKKVVLNKNEIKTFNELNEIITKSFEKIIIFND